MFERRFLIAFFIYLVLEGALRKWLLPSYSIQLFLVKDLLLLGALIGYLSKIIFHRNNSPSVFTHVETLLLWGWVLFFSGYLLISGVSFSSIAGLRYYLIMLPVILMVPYVITDTYHLNYLARRYLWLALAVAVLGFIQFVSPPDALINRYAWNVETLDVAIIGENKTRITGTFSYITPYTVYLQFVFLMALALFNQAEDVRRRMLLGLTAAMLFVNILMSGSRAPFIISLILAIPFLWSSLKKMAIQRGLIFPVLATILVTGLFLYQFSGLFSLLSERNREAQDTKVRITGAFLTPINTLRAASFAGAGIGSTFMGVREASGSSETASFDEVNEDRIGVETGIFGFLFVLLFKLFFLVKGWFLYRRATDTAIKNWALVVFGYQLSFLGSIPIYNSVAAAFYFACLGLYVMLRREQNKLQTAWSEVQTV